MEIKQFLVAQIPLQVLSDAHRSHSHGRTGKKQITYLQRHEATDIGNDIIHTEQHVRRTSTLNGLPVDIKMEVQSLHVASRLSQWHKVAYSSRPVKPFAQFPRITHLAEAALHIAGSKVDTYRHSIIIAMGKTWRNTFTQATNTHYHFGFIVYLV